MSVLHLCFDGNFINNCLHVFEKYYPNQNIFIVNKEKSDLQMIRDDERIFGIPLTKQNYSKIRQVCLEKKVDKLVFHGIYKELVPCAKYLLSFESYKVYWIFWGYELYFPLGQMGKYNLIDGKLNPFSLHTYLTPNVLSFAVKRALGIRMLSYVLKEALDMIDYFCFWNYKDYELLQKHFNTKIRFKFFAYSAFERSVDSIIVDSSIIEKRQKTILINHQASNTGNHYTVMKKVAGLDSMNEFQKIVPLSYGSNKIRKLVMKDGKRIFQSQFYPILNYMSQDEYFHLVNTVEVAIFGAKRQEASGNISTLLKSGTKVFLREDNNLLQYYKEKGYVVFSFEKDLNSIDDLKPLTPEKQEYNRENGIKNRIYYDQFMPIFFNE